MQKQIFYLLCMIMLFTGSAMAQPKFSGESDPFVFNTQAQSVPVASLAVVITVVLATSFILYRFWKQKRNATT